MKRREFLALAGGTAAAVCPVPLSGQQSAVPAIGYLSSGSPDPDSYRLVGLRRGLNEAGYVEGRNVGIEYRWAANQCVRYHGGTQRRCDSLCDDTIFPEDRNLCRSLRT